MCRTWWPFDLDLYLQGHSTLFWLGIQHDSIVWVIMRRRLVSSERRRCSFNFNEDISHGSPYVSSAVEWRTAVFPWRRNPINWNMVWVPHSHSLIDLECRWCFMKYANSFVWGFYWIHKICFLIFLRVASQAYTSLLGYVVLQISHCYLVIISNLLAF